jgi:hypothetical protein
MLLHLQKINPNFEYEIDNFFTKNAQFLEKGKIRTFYSKTYAFKTIEFQDIISSPHNVRSYPHVHYQKSQCKYRNITFNMDSKKFEVLNILQCKDAIGKSDSFKTCCDVHYSLRQFCHDSYKMIEKLSKSYLHLSFFNLFPRLVFSAIFFGNKMDSVHRHHYGLCVDEFIICHEIKIQNFTPTIINSRVKEIFEGCGNVQAIPSQWSFEIAKSLRNFTCEKKTLYLKEHSLDNKLCKSYKMEFNMKKFMLYIISTSIYDVEFKNEMISFLALLSQIYPIY